MNYVAPPGTYHSSEPPSSGLACKSSPLRILDDFGIDKKTDIAPRPPWSVARVLAEKACWLTGLMMIDGQKMIMFERWIRSKKGPSMIRQRLHRYDFSRNVQQSLGCLADFATVPHEAAPSMATRCFQVCFKDPSRCPCLDPSFTLDFEAIQR